MLNAEQPLRSHPNSPNLRQHRGLPRVPRRCVPTAVLSTLSGLLTRIIVYRDNDHQRFREYRGFDNRAGRTSWHSDVSYERQPPGTTFFWVLDQPESGGGDTLFLSQVEAYNRLSDGFKQRLEGLRAVHSAVYQAEFSRKRGGPVRREPVESEVRLYHFAQSRANSHGMRSTPLSAYTQLQAKRRFTSTRDSRVASSGTRRKSPKTS